MPSYPNAGNTDSIMGPIPGWSRAAGASLSPQGGGANASRLSQIMVVFPPRERPIPGATLFTVFGSVATNVAQANVAIPGTAIQIPAGSLARLDSITFYVDNLLTTSAVSFTVRQNQGGIAGFTNFQMMPGNVAQAISNNSVLVDVVNGALLDVAFTNTDGGAYIVGARLSGWSWPESLGRLYMQQGQLL